MTFKTTEKNVSIEIKSLAIDNDIPQDCNQMEYLYVFLQQYMDKQISELNKMATAQISKDVLVTLRQFRTNLGWGFVTFY